MIIDILSLLSEFSPLHQNIFIIKSVFVLIFRRERERESDAGAAQSYNCSLLLLMQ